MSSPTQRDNSGLAGAGFVLNVNFVFLSTVASYGVGFVVVVLMSRALGAEGRGVTALYTAAVSLGFAFLSLGTSAAAVYFVGRREITPRGAMEVGVSVSLLATALTALAVGLARVFFGDDLAAANIPYWLAIPAVPAVIQFRLLEGVLRAQGRFGAMNVIELLMPLSMLCILGGIELSAGLTVERTVYGWSLAFLPPVVFGYAVIGRAHWPAGLAGGARLLTMVRFGLQSQLSDLIQLLNYRLDSYLVLFLVDKAGVGLYANGVSLSEGMWFIANSAAVVLLTSLTAGDHAAAARMTPVVCRNTIALTALSALAAAALAPFAIPALFGGDFDGAVMPFLCLLPGTVALAGSKILAAYVFSRGRPLINAAIAAVTLVVTVAADLVLIPLLDVTGAAVGASIAYATSLALTAVAYQRLSGASIVAALLPRPSDLSLYVGAARDLLRRLRPARPAPGPARSDP